MKLVLMFMNLKILPVCNNFLLLHVKNTMPP